MRKPFYYTMECAIERCFDVPAFHSLDFHEDVNGYFRDAYYIATLPFTLSLLGGAIFIDGVNDLFNYDRFTHVEGFGTKKDQIETIMSWNVCMLFGGLPIPCGGGTASSKRCPFVAKKILEAPSDLLCLQEVSQDAAFVLYELLKHEYSHFYIKINPDPWFSLDSSMFIASKVALTDVQVVEIPPGESLRKAALTFTVNDVRFIVTHLKCGYEEADQKMRTTQSEALLQNFPEGKRILIGDLNMDRAEFRTNPLSATFHDTLPEEVGPTFTDHFTHRLRSDIPLYDAAIDYILSTDEIKLEISLGQGFNKETNYALSDHHPLFAKITAQRQ